MTIAVREKVTRIIRYWRIQQAMALYEYGFKPFFRSTMPIEDLITKELKFKQSVVQMLLAGRNSTKTEIIDEQRQRQGDRNLREDDRASLHNRSIDSAPTFKNETRSSSKDHDDGDFPHSSAREPAKDSLYFTQLTNNGPPLYKVAPSQQLTAMIQRKIQFRSRKNLRIACQYVVDQLAVSSKFIICLRGFLLPKLPNVDYLQLQAKVQQKVFNIQKMQEVQADGREFYYIHVNESTTLDSNDLRSLSIKVQSQRGATVLCESTLDLLALMF